MRKIAILIALLLPGLASAQSLVRPLTKARADKLYLSSQNADNYAVAFDEENTDAYTVNAADEWHLYHTNGGTAPLAEGWTLDAGGGGTSHAITAIADAGGGDITVTTGTSHDLAVGAMVSQTDLTDAAYVGVFEVLTVPSPTTYTVTAVYTATDTGTMDEGQSLVAGADAAGLYLFTYTASSSAAVANHVFDWVAYKNASQIGGSEVRRKYGGVGDFGVFGATVIFSVAAGDKIMFAGKNIGASGNFTIRYITLTIHRL